MTTNMFLKRTFQTPLSVAEVSAIGREIGWCLEMHKVNWRASFLAVNGRTMLCWFAAPDAESVRVAIQKAGADSRLLWAGTVHEAPEPAVPNVLVERSFDQPVALEEIQSMGRTAAWCLQAHQVKYARTFFAADRRRMLCLYEAPDAESVRLAQREGAMPVDAIWAFDRITPDTIASAPG